MVSIGELWFAILLSTIAVWAASAINRIVMPHRGLACIRHRRGPRRDLVRATLVRSCQRASGLTRLRSPDRWILRLVVAGMRLT